MKPLARRNPALFAWALCGTLDIVYASVWSVLAGGSVGGMLRGVAKGPFGDAAADWGTGGALAGLATHYAIMGTMVAFWFAAVRRVPSLRQPWWLTGTVYGFTLYLVMNALVLPLRFGAPFPPADLVKGMVALFPHIFFIGLPLAWLTRKAA
ncbi:hypothetical protein CVO77_09310 [Sphingopyxis lindanitolerans]|uniref:DUF1440 domain-containing protein n=1 Tax=Sphingopyxis lindanitolerans TaxID=2054227 RepID=A0A2S8B8F2_9SPHN|nr:hypothetical protein [Sphingopyxis lindanitolerans]PQM28627.1 hypothetical protein CVO77_09310 [Sphingopyxis lindanitolerans]